MYVLNFLVSSTCMFPLWILCQPNCVDRFSLMVLLCFIMFYSFSLFSHTTNLLKSIFYFLGMFAQSSITWYVFSISLFWVNSTSTALSAALSWRVVEFWRRCFFCFSNRIYRKKYKIGTASCYGPIWIQIVNHLQLAESSFSSLNSMGNGFQCTKP